MAFKLPTPEQVRNMTPIQPISTERQSIVDIATDICNQLHNKYKPQALLIVYGRPFLATIEGRKFKKVTSNPELGMDTWIGTYKRMRSAGHSKDELNQDMKRMISYLVEDLDWYNSTFSQ